MRQPFFTIIMPTYNSERTIELALSSIRNQTIDQDEIEILVIDGGSTDNTLRIAEKYGACILENPRRYPEYAKQIGFTNATGIYVIEQDSDEVYSNQEQLLRRKKFLEENKEVYCLIVDRLMPAKKCGISNSYINWFGDPFSYIVYGLKGSRIKENRHALIYETELGNVYQYKEDDIIPIGDGGTTTINLKKAKELFGNFITSQEFAVSNFHLLVQKTGYMGCIPDDNIVHYSQGGFRSYLRKLHFRVYTNLNCVEQSGYSSRARSSKILTRRKLLFVVYVLTVAGPIIDSVRLSVLNKDARLLLHFLYVYYVVIMIMIELFKKVFKIKGKDMKYGQ